MFSRIKVSINKFREYPFFFEMSKADPKHKSISILKTRIIRINHGRAFLTLN